jgi:hypothetical protein
MKVVLKQSNCKKLGWPLVPIWTKNMKNTEDMPSGWGE